VGQILPGFIVGFKLIRRAAIEVCERRDELLYLVLARVFPADCLDFPHVDAFRQLGGTRSSFFA
jgi:hypothetical protein